MPQGSTGISPRQPVICPGSFCPCRRMADHQNSATKSWMRPFPELAIFVASDFRAAPLSAAAFALHGRPFPLAADHFHSRLRCRRSLPIRSTGFRVSRISPKHSGRRNRVRLRQRMTGSDDIAYRATIRGPSPELRKPPRDGTAVILSVLTGMQADTRACTPAGLVARIGPP